MNKITSIIDFNMKIFKN